MTKLFNAAAATATLPLVAAIAGDYEKLSGTIADLEAELEMLPDETTREPKALSPEEIGQIKEQLARHRSKREALLCEFAQLGVKTVISSSGWLSGVHFGSHDGQRKSYLCWRIGETGVDCWHEAGVSCAEREEVLQNPDTSRACLVGCNGPVSGRRFQVNAGTTRIGRAPDCEIQLEDFAVSRQHANIVLQDGGYYLEDLNSRNHTYLNGQLVENGRRPLRDNDRVTVCDIVFRFARVGLPPITMQLPVVVGSDSGDSSIVGSITNMIQRTGDLQQGALSDLFERVMCDLREKAVVILRGFPNARGWQAEDLISETYCGLRRRLETGAITDRRHLYATACKHFRWKLLSVVGADHEVTNQELSFSDPGDDDESPSKLIARGEGVERLLEALDCLDKGYRQIVDMHNFLDKTFEEIGQELGLPTSTVYDRYRKALAMLRGVLM